MNSTKKKTGRKPKSHKCSWDNQTIDGLYHCPDGRWRVVATGYRFTEPDERLAVAHFFKLTQPKQTVTLSATAGEVCRASLPSTVPNNAEAIVAAAAKVRHELDGSPGTVHFDLRKAPADWDMTLEANEAHVWAWLRKQIVERPKYVAMRTGIEQIGYLADVPRPTPSPELDKIGSFYHGEKKLSKNWAVKSKQFWQEFMACVGVSTARELTQDSFLQYHGSTIATASALPKGGKTYVNQRFGQVKTILNYPPKRGKWAEDCTRALAFAKVLVKLKKNKLNPNPIEPEDFQRLLDVANPEQRALMLCMLNFCMYGSEAAAIQRDELDLHKRTFVSERAKTGITRIGIVWERTAQAIMALPAKGPSLFVSESGAQADYDCVKGWWNNLRKAAGLPNVQLSEVRDSAYTAAAEAKTPLEQCEMLAGHSVGMADHYIRRRPQLVDDACQRIELAYFGRKRRLAKAA